MENKNYNCKYLADGLGFYLVEGIKPESLLRYQNIRGWS
jgi:hypothetical protein